MVLSLKQGVIYGPVRSRRLGNSLGINIMPGRYKLCSFNCIYCHYGWTNTQALDLAPYRDDMPARREAVRAIEASLRSGGEFDYITFSGNGEPTLYPEFPELVDDVIRLRDTYRPNAKIGLLSNATGLMYDRVRRTVPKIDFPMFKLDAGSEKIFTAVNRPASDIEFNTLVDHLADLPGILLQTVLVDGSPSNVSDDELTAYFGLVRRIHPVEVHIYSIDRPVPESGITLVPPGRLEAIARRGTAETGVPIRAFYPRPSEAS